MKIAITADGDTLENRIPDTLEESRFLLIVETDDRRYEVYENPEGQTGYGLSISQKIIEQDCEAVICGTIEKPAFEVLAAAQVTRYMGGNLMAINALNLMEAYQLDMIRVPNGETWEHHNHDEGTCNCGK